MILSNQNTREGNKENLDIWYGDHRFRTKNLKEYVEFQKNLLDEILVGIAHVCGDIAKIEQRR